MVRSGDEVWVVCIDTNPRIDNESVSCDFKSIHSTERRALDECARQQELCADEEVYFFVISTVVDETH